MNEALYLLLEMKLFARNVCAGMAYLCNEKWPLNRPLRAYVNAVYLRKR